MANPVKPLNRLKPFQRINNDAFVVDQAPDGFGVPCGCHTPNEFKNLEGEFKKFLDDHLPLPLLKILDTVDDIASTAADAAKGAAVAAAGILIGLEALLGSAGTPIGTVIGALLGFATAAFAISSFISNVVGVITLVLRTFLVKIGLKLAHRAIRVTPQWVPVLKGASSQRITRDQIKEVEGIVTRSYGDPIEPPFFQWHTWLNWAIHVQPEPRYQNIVSPAGNPPNTKEAQDGEEPIAQANSFEIHWDTGALFEQPMSFRGDFLNPYETGFKEGEMTKLDGPMTTGDWLWPLTGMFVWASGRWVYDCSRTTASEDKPQMCSMINPPRAIATATWEAVQFAENNPGDQTSSKVPALRFMFFACKRGGYMSYDTLADEDYEFILDLPPLDLENAPFPIGHTPDVPHSVITVRPRLLRSTVNLPFVGAKLLDPVIEEIPSGDPAIPPKQVKLTIPKSQLDGVDAAGVILSLGWFDPTLEQADRVMKCTLAFSGLAGRFTVRDDSVKQIREMFKEEEEALRKEIEEKVAGIKILGLGLNDIPVVTNPLNGQKIDLGGALKEIVKKIVDAALKAFIDMLAAAIGEATQTEEWLLRVGMNGRWESRYFKELKKGAFALPQPIIFEVFLGPDDFLFYSSGGVEFNPVGEMMRAPRKDRQLTNPKKSGLPFTWEEIVNANANDRRELIFQYALEILEGNSASASPALGIENAVLGLIDPDFTKIGDIPETANPLRMRDLQPQTVQFNRLVRFARATRDQEILLENDKLDDYQLSAQLSIKRQRP